MRVRGRGSGFGQEGASASSKVPAKASEAPPSSAFGSIQLSCDFPKGFHQKLLGLSVCCGMATSVPCVHDLHQLAAGISRSSPAWTSTETCRLNMSLAGKYTLRVFAGRGWLQTDIELSECQEAPLALLRSNPNRDERTG